MEVTKNKNNIYVPCSLLWSKLREEDRDMGNGNGTDMDKKIESVQGNYCVTLVITNQTYSEMELLGIPTKGLHGQLFSETEDGWEYRVKRGHFNPAFTDKSTGEKGVIIGAPAVVYEDDDGVMRPWDFDEMGLLGNGTVAKVKLDLWRKNGLSKVTLEAVRVISQVEYDEDSISEKEGF